MSGATIMAPMTVAVLSAMTPAVAMIVASTRSTQNLLAEGLRHERSMKSASVMRSMSSVVTVVGMGTPFSRAVIVPLRGSARTGGAPGLDLSAIPVSTWARLARPIP